MANDAESNGTPRGESAGGYATNGQGWEVCDRRRRQVCTLEDWIFEEYGEALGPYGLAVYAAWAYYGTIRHKGHHPSYACVARLLGISRTKVERVMRDLTRVHGLIHVERRVSPAGQRTNVVHLLDPCPEQANVSEGAHLSESPANSRGGAVPQPGGRRTTAGAPPAVVRRPHVEGSPIQERESSAPAPCAAPFTKAAERIADTFAAQVVGVSAAQRVQVHAEALAEAGQLLGQGYTEEQLMESVYDPARPREQWPREWRAGLRLRKPAQDASKRAEVARRSAQKEEERQARERGTQEAAEVKRLAQEALDRLKGKRQKPRPRGE